MKFFLLSAVTMLATCTTFSQPAKKKTTANTTKKSLFIDVHNLEPGKVNFADVMAAHQKDLATETKYGVNFIKFWVDEKGGKVYCLSSANDSQSIAKTHADAHGLLPARVFKVSDGGEEKSIKGKNFFIDVHNLGAGNVTADAAAGAR
ncbi:MAG: DUF4242 domain-containing protein [Ferruginibacter sp.]